jgi:hypothetical protein
MSPIKKDMYVRKDGKLLYDKEALKERKRAMARMKARDLHNLRQKHLKPETDQSKSEIDQLNCSSNTSNAECYSNSTNSESVHSTNLSAKLCSANAHASSSKGNVNYLNGEATGVRVSATATANGGVCSISNANLEMLNFFNNLLKIRDGDRM